jgi:CheY-like chemotaxis protein
MGSPLAANNDADETGRPVPSRVPRLAAIVDDESGVRAYLAAVIKKMGLQPVEAASPEEVLKIIERDENALVLLDLSLGRSDGVLVLEELAAHKFTGSVILISGHDQVILDQVNSIGRRLKLTMLPSLKKPFKPDALRQIVRDAALMPTEGPVKLDVLKALKQNRVELYYQPKIDLRSLAPIGAEAQIVVNDPTHGVVGEERLSDLSQEERAALTMFSLRRAIKDWEKLAADSVVLRLAVKCRRPIFSTATSSKSSAAAGPTTRAGRASSSKFPNAAFRQTRPRCRTPCSASSCTMSTLPSTTWK